MMLSRIKGRVCGLGLVFLLILVRFRVCLGVALFVPFSPPLAGMCPYHSLLVGALFYLSSQALTVVRATPSRVAIDSCE